MCTPSHSNYASKHPHLFNNQHALTCLVTYTHTHMHTHIPPPPPTHTHPQPCKAFLKQSDIQFMFSEMVGRSEQLFFSPVESAEDNLLHLPAFLEALDSIVKEMGEVCLVIFFTESLIVALSHSSQLSETFLHSLEKLMVLLFEYFPLLPPILHKPVFFAVMKMILGMAANWSTLKTFLSQIGELVELEVDYTVGTVVYTGGGGRQVLTEHEIEAHCILFCSFGIPSAVYQGLMLSPSCG